MKNQKSELIYKLVESICALYEEAEEEDNLECESEGLDSFSGKLSQDDMEIPQDSVENPDVLDDKDVKDVKDSKETNEALDNYAGDDDDGDYTTKDKAKEKEQYKTNSKAKQQADADAETESLKKIFNDYSKFVMPKVQKNFETALAILDKQFESGKVPKAIGKALYAIYKAGEKVAQGGYADGALTILRMLGYGSQCFAERADLRYNKDHASPVTYLKSGFLRKLDNIMTMAMYNELPIQAYVLDDGTLQRLRVKFQARFGLDYTYQSKEDPEALKVLAGAARARGGHEWPYTGDKNIPGMKEFANNIQQEYGPTSLNVIITDPYSLEFIFDTSKKGKASYTWKSE